MVDKDRIRSMFGLFSDLPESEIDRWSGLLETARQKLEASLRKDVNVAANMERLAIAAAAFACADYMMIDGSSSLRADEYKVGDITVKSSSGSSMNKQDSESIREYFQSQICDLVHPSSFALKPIEVAQ